MPMGWGPAVGMPPATNDVLATWKISTRDSGVFVRYSSPVPPLPFLLKIASPIWLPPGSGLVTPATTVAVSAFGVPATTPLTGEYAQLRPTALFHPYARTPIVCRAFGSAARFRLHI